MTKNSRALLAAVGLCVCSLRVLAAVTVPAGESHVLTTAENVSTQEILLNDGATLVIPALLGSDVNVKVRVDTADAAAATISVESGVSSVKFTSGLRTGTGGSLVVSGIGSIAIGATPSNDLIYPLLQVESLTFSDAGATGLVLTEKVTLAKTPTTCPLSIAAGATLALMEENALDPFGYTGDEISLVDFDIVILKENAISPSKTIRVSPGRCVGVKPCNLLGKWSWTGVTATWNLPSVVLGGAGSKVVFRNGPQGKFMSFPISGVGDVSFKPDSPAMNSTMIYGPMTFDGCFSVDNASQVITTTSAFGGGSRAVRLADGAVMQPNGTTTFTSLSIGDNSTLSILANSSVTFGTVSAGGTLSVASADGTYGGKVVFAAGASFPAGFKVLCARPARLVFDDGAAAGGLACLTEGGAARLWPDALGVIDCEGLVLGGGARAASLYSTGAKLVNMAPEFSVSVNGSAEVTPSSLSSQVSVRAESGGAVTVGEMAANWQSALMLWIDPSVTSVEPVSLNAAKACTYDGNSVFERIRDVRGDQQTKYALWNRRYYSDSTFNWQVYPYLVSGGCNGLSYFSCGGYQATGVARTYVFPDESTVTQPAGTAEARRILLSKDGGTTASAPTAVGAVTMVFGSQNGGGAAIVGTKYGAFGRTGTTLNDAITTNDLHDVYVNGVKVDPTVTKLSGGWDVITVVMDDELLSAFGWCGSDRTNNDYTHCGGQNYGEILVFGEVPTDEQRVCAERYLAKKWGLAQKYAGASNPVRLAGSGTVRVGEGRVCASGSFSGTIELDGGTLSVAPVALPAGEESLPKSGLIGWYDPDDGDSILLNADSGFGDAASLPDLVWALYDRSRPERANGDPFLFGVQSRRPCRHRESRGDGPVRNWIHCQKLSSYGTVLRFMQLPLPALSTGSVTAVPLQGVREVFMVRDSSRGGGSAVIDKINGSIATTDMLAMPRRTSDASSPIWPMNTAAVITNGITRLNGQVVDGSRQGFTGGAELFSFSTAADYAPVAFSDLYNSQQVGGSYYEIYGETLIYSSVLSDADRTKVEDYLNYKWLGVLPGNCSDLRGATVAGTGVVSGTTLADMPKIASTFAGTVKADSNADLEIAIDGSAGTVTGALIAPSATLDFPAAATVTVTLNGRMPNGGSTYTLVDCAGFARPVSWTLTFVDGDGKGRTATLRTTGGKVLLDVRGKGLLVIVL